MEPRRVAPIVHSKAHCGEVMQVSELRPFKAKAKRATALEAEVSEKQRQIAQLEEQLSEARTASRVGSNATASREESRPSASDASQPTPTSASEVCIRL